MGGVEGGGEGGGLAEASGSGASGTRWRRELDNAEEGRSRLMEVAVAVAEVARERRGAENSAENNAEEGAIEADGSGSSSGGSGTIDDVAQRTTQLSSNVTTS